MDTKDDVHEEMSSGCKIKFGMQIILGIRRVTTVIIRKVDRKRKCKRIA